MKENNLKKVTIKAFSEEEIPLKVQWVNNPKNNTYLHYDLPLSVEGTNKWFASTKDRNDRYDATIFLDEKPVGLIGLLSMDPKNKKAEYYVLLGDTEVKGQGVAKRASHALLEKAFDEFELNKVYLYTEVENLLAQHLFESVGFKREGTVREDVYRDGSYHDRILYGLLKSDYDDAK